MIKCLVKDCEKHAKCRGLCSSHYWAWYKGDMSIPILEPKTKHWEPDPLADPSNPNQCNVPNCGRPPSIRGLCTVHYGQWCRGNKLIPAGKTKMKGTPVVSHLCPDPFRELEFTTITQIRIPFDKNVRGLYKLYDKDVVLYIGKSDNVWLRLMEHFSERWPISRVDIYIEPSSLLCSIWESWLIWKYNPLKNRTRRNLPISLPEDMMWKILEKNRVVYSRVDNRRR